MNRRKRLLTAGVGAAVAVCAVLAIPTAADAATKKPKRCMAQGALSATADAQVDGEDALATGMRHVTKGSPCRDVNVRLPKAGGRRCSSVRVRWVGGPTGDVGVAGLPGEEPREPVGVAAIPDDQPAPAPGKVTAWRDVCSGRWTVVAKSAAEGAGYRLEVRGSAGEAIGLKVRD